MNEYYLKQIQILSGQQEQPLTVPSIKDPFQPAHGQLPPSQQEQEKQTQQKAKGKGPPRAAEPTPNLPSYEQPLTRPWQQNLK
jgi:hypothetical protein